ncbi:MAG TPA: FAD-dependent oxidoreductase [Stellaceae bacterium]|nr:FAD-dependent oxidoreductase [Stellaceae bacterium]
MISSSSPLAVAVVGSGIAGLSASWLLQRRHSVTLYEKAAKLGGHCNTVDVPSPDGNRLAVDTGFIVYNTTNYPNLVALFQHLGVATHPSDMSFAVSLDEGGLEYAGTDLRGLFAQPSNLLRPRFWAMLRDLVRFYRAAPGLLRRADGDAMSIGRYLDEGGYSRAFIDDHLLPMGAAIWSSTAADMRQYPAASFIRFFESHGLLRLARRPEWRTVTGGSRRYVERIAEPLAGHVRLACPVRSIRRQPDGVLVEERGGRLTRFDHVVLATHADEALALLADPSPAESALLGAFRYARNVAVLHSDPRLMPRRRRAWASWNYIGRSDGELCVSYWMNLLQGLDRARDFFVTINPVRPPRETLVHASFRYEHPGYDAAAVAAQQRLWTLQGVRRTWFCGAYFGAGFHEDGLQSGLAAAEALGGVRRPWSVANESGRIVLAPEPLSAEAAS